jgi:hypothetical protein
LLPSLNDVNASAPGPSHRERIANAHSEIDHVLNKEVHQAADLGVLEQAFCALVAFPKEKPIVGLTLKTLGQTLSDVVAALYHDENIMPRATCEALQVELGSTYHHGALVVGGKHPRFIDSIAKSIGVSDVRMHTTRVQCELLDGTRFFERR